MAIHNCLIYDFLARHSYVANHPVAVFCVLGLVVYLVSCVVPYAKARATWKTVPMLVFPISPLSIWSSFAPRGKWNPSTMLTWNERFKLYTTAGSEVIAVIGVLKGTPSLYVSSPEVIRQVLGNKAPFNTKPPSAKNTLGFLGTNVVASDGDTWKTHRRITAPAFTHEGYMQVWTETTRIYNEMTAVEGWDGQDTVVLSNTYRITRKLALFIIASCGFNIPLSWADGDVDNDGGMSLQAVFSTVASSILTRWLTPKWAYHLGNKRLQRIDTAYRRLDSFLNSQIGVRKDEIRDEINSYMEPLEAKRDLFSRLVAASVDEGKSGLSDQEIKGNTFVMIFAGHETTAHTLATTLVLLGLYEEEQTRLHDRIIDILGVSPPTFEDYETLEPVILSIVYEAMRLYPAGFMLLRQADEDTSLSVPKMDGSGETQLLVPKGTDIVVDMVGACYNQRWYPARDVNSFDPSRWDGRLDSSLTFAYGPRICLGKKFATTEIVCFLSLLLRDWKVQVEREGGETREQWRERVMHPALALTMNLPPLPVKLVRRKLN